ncbi:hypothetical protein SNEBB_008252 [Seison nebaliae]|nr:hypothetical protein SNEBB_008252 [Seison nebaliae]
MIRVLTYKYLDIKLLIVFNIWSGRVIKKTYTEMDGFEMELIASDKNKDDFEKRREFCKNHNSTLLTFVNKKLVTYIKKNINRNNILHIKYNYDKKLYQWEEPPFWKFKDDCPLWRSTQPNDHDPQDKFVSICCGDSLDSYEEGRDFSTICAKTIKMNQVNIHLTTQQKRHRSMKQLFNEITDQMRLGIERLTPDCYEETAEYEVFDNYFIQHN